MIGCSYFASGIVGSSSHEMEYRNVGPMSLIATKAAQLMTHKIILCRNENRRASELDRCSGSIAADEELTPTL